MRVTARSGEVVILRTPRLERDSVAGTEPRTRARRAVALADVTRVEAYRIGVGATVGAVAAGALAGLAALYLVAGVLVARGT